MRWLGWFVEFQNPSLFFNAELFQLQARLVLFALGLSGVSALECHPADNVLAAESSAVAPLLEPVCRQAQEVANLKIVNIKDSCRCAASV